MEKGDSEVPDVQNRSGQYTFAKGRRVKGFLKALGQDDDGVGSFFEAPCGLRLEKLNDLYMRLLKLVEERLEKKEGKFQMKPPEREEACRKCLVRVYQRFQFLLLYIRFHKRRPLPD